MTGPAYFKNDEVIIKYILGSGSGKRQISLAPIMHVAISSYRLFAKLRTGQPALDYQQKKNTKERKRRRMDHFATPVSKGKTIQ